MNDSVKINKMKTEHLIQEYYAAFNKQDRKKMLSCLSEDVIHEINQGGMERGLDSFNRFLDKMDSSYKETLTNIHVMVNSTGQRASAEFTVNGIYLKTDPGLPEAHGQKYVISAGTFFEVDIETQKIKRVTTYYNLPAWVAAVGG